MTTPRGAQPRSLHCIGGGPGGLYFAILAKRAFPQAEVVVHERSPADLVAGWGVVFSDETMGNLELADAESYRSMREGFAYWDRIDVRHRGDVVRSGGHGFCGISRRRMLEKLRFRAEELGVELRYEDAIDDPATLAGADLIVAADGINSAVRERFHDHFVPSIEWGECHFMWLGTRQRFEAFTFDFVEQPEGVLQCHAYQFEPETSTFIVETDAETFEALKLGTRSEQENLRFLEQAFHQVLGRQPLMANHSEWIRFRTLSCERWSHGNVALLGDAAHTAHFSVGSGTKMAMEDAIDLVRALESEADVPAALARYEQVGKDRVGRTQKAAAQSQRWFEETRRHVKLPTPAFAFSLLSRSRRITRDNMRVRDAAYIEALDRDYMRERELPNASDAPLVPAMFTPFDVGGLRLDNRVVVSPMCQYSAQDGAPGDWHLVHYGSRAIGGPGLLIAEMTDVLAEGRISDGCAGLYDEGHVAAWARIVDFVHAQSSTKFGVQLGHAGRKGACKRPWLGVNEPLEQGWPLIAPSAVPWKATNQTPQEMTRDDMVRVREAFVTAADRAVRAGFDLVELHMAHGYLLSSFLTPLTNRRTDEYGGDLAARARFPLEVLDAVREKHPDLPLSVRISATDWVPGGFDIEDAVALATMLKAHGAHVVDVSSGQTTPDAQPVYGRAYQTPFAERIRNEVGIPTMTVGAIWDQDRINTILLAGRADLVAVARGHLADPYLTRHAAAGLGYDLPWPKPYLMAAGAAERMFRPLGD